MRVVKCGATTGRTDGTVDFIYHDVHLPGNLEATSEYTVPTKADEMYSVFSARGDLGSFVLDMEGKVVGIVIGGTNGIAKVLSGYEKWGCIFASYITPMKLIKQKVESWIGPFEIAKS